MDEQQIRAALLDLLGTEALTKDRFEALVAFVYRIERERKKHADEAYGLWEQAMGDDL